MRPHPIALLLLAITLAAPTQSQPRPPQGQMETLPFLFISAVSFPDTAVSPCRVDVRYRIDREFFIPVLSDDPAAGGPYLRRGEVLIELFDSTTSSSAARKIEIISLPEQRAEADPAVRTWHEGAATFTVPPGAYSVFFEATDRQSQRRVVRHELLVRTPGAESGVTVLHPVAFIQPVQDLAGAVIRPGNFGDDILYGEERHLLLAFVLPPDAPATAAADYRIMVERGGAGARIPAVAETLAALPLIRDHDLRPVDGPDQPGYRFIPRPGSRVGFVAVPLKTAALPLRTYSLQVRLTLGSRTAEFVRTFRNVWPAMPRSLRNVDEALEALRFIASESTIDSLTSGDFERRRDGLEAFWAARDATPGTVMNEVMIEYYRRVDHARLTYGTLAEPDGTRSDRGRIFILNGQPTRIERSLSPAGAHTETWIYEKSGRRFTFVDERRNGTYMLLTGRP